MRTAMVTLRVTPQERVAWQRAAKAARKGLSEWMRSVLNRAASPAPWSTYTSIPTTHHTCNPAFCRVCRRSVAQGEKT